VRPPLSRQKSPAERFLFRNIWLIWALNGVLLGAFVFLWHQGIEPAWVLLVLSLPSVVAQAVCIVLASYWDVHDSGKQQRR
jgi:cell shape-determining protein MreD